MTLESDPARENDSENNAYGEPAQKGQSTSQLSPTARVSEPQNAQRPNPYQIAYKTKKDGYDKVKFWVEILGLIVLVVYTAYTIKMYSANKKAADAAKSAADTAACALRDNRAAITAQQGIAQNTLNQTLEISRTDQRAWVGVKFVRMITLEAGKHVSASVDMENTGKTFALNTVADVTIVSTPHFFDIQKYANSPNRQKPKTLPSVEVLSPNSEGDLRAESSMIVNEATVDAIKNGTLLIYLFGDIHYKDIFGRPHLTRFCYEYFPEVPLAFISCSQPYSYAN